MNHQLAPQIPSKSIKRIMRSAGAGCVSRGAIDIRNAKTLLQDIPPEILDKFEFWEIVLFKIVEKVDLKLQKKGRKENNEPKYQGN